MSGIIIKWLFVIQIKEIIIEKKSERKSKSNALQGRYCHALKTLVKLV